MIRTLSSSQEQKHPDLYQQVFRLLDDRITKSVIALRLDHFLRSTRV